MPTDPSPNLFLVGAQKSGTSALAGWLGQHPQVYMSFPKEPGFLAFGSNGYPYLDGYGRSAPASKYVVNSEEAYRRLFTGAGKQHRLIGEASTWYLATTGTAATIKARCPAAKIVIILRNPVDRAYSAWCHARSDMLEPCDQFEQALALEESRGEVEFLLRYRAMGLYSEALAEYQALFDPTHLLVLYYENLRADPVATWQTLCHFLDIDSTHQPDYGARYNTAGQPRSRLLQSVLHSHRLKGWVRRVLPHRIAMRLKAGVDAINLETLPEMNAASRQHLREFFREDITALSALTGRDCGAWLE